MNKEGKGGFQDHPELRNNGHPMAGTSYKEIFQRIADEPPGYEPEPHQIRSKKEEHCRAWFRKSYDDIRAFEHQRFNKGDKGISRRAFSRST